jgi:hypothetical protein
MDLSMEQRLAVRFSFKAGKRATESLQMVNAAYGAKQYSIRKFSDGTDGFMIDLKTLKTIPEVAGLQCSNGNNVEKISQLFHQKRHISLRMQADEVKFGKGTVKTSVVEDLPKRNVCSTFVPHSLTPELKDRPTTRQS